MTHDWTTIPNSTETMAERAWRYGLDAEPCESVVAWMHDRCFYADRSALLLYKTGQPAYVVPNWDLEVPHWELE